MNFREAMATGKPVRRASKAGGKDADFVILPAPESIVRALRLDASGKPVDDVIVMLPPAETQAEDWEIVQ